MLLVYFLVGCLAVFLIHFTLKRIGALPEHERSKMRWMLLVGGALILIILLARFGAHWLAALFSGFLALTALVSRLLIWIPIAQWFRQPRSAVADMDAKQAREILGVSAEASREEIIAAHRRLMKKLHPDAGGTESLAQQLNQAKDTLLKD